MKSNAGYSELQKRLFRAAQRHDSTSACLLGIWWERWVSRAEMKGKSWISTGVYRRGQAEPARVVAGKLDV